MFTPRVNIVHFGEHHVHLKILPFYRLSANMMFANMFVLFFTTCRLFFRVNVYVHSSSEAKIDETDTERPAGLHDGH